jgi:glycosyltransferase involved in cell wall biosynthesis
MRFLFISTMASFPWGGSEELWSCTALRLRGQGHEVSASVVWWPQLSPKVLELGKRGIRLFFRKQPVHQTLPVRVWHKAKPQLGLQEGAVKWLRKHKPDLVVISQGGNKDGWKWMKFCREAGLPYVTKVSCNSETWWPGDDFAAEFTQSYRAARKIFCVSHHNLELLEYQIGESLSNATVCWSRYTVSPDQLHDWPVANGIWKLACVARLDPVSKGQDLLLQVLSQRQWQERPLEVSFYGTGPCEQSLKKLANHLQVENGFFRGHMANVSRIWEENHLLVLPSRSEGLPLALVEAMWCGRPAVVTDIGGNAEVCVDGETGFVAAAPAVKPLEETLERAWERRHDWQEMGKLARARAEQFIPKDPVGDFCRQIIECVE